MNTDSTLRRPRALFAMAALIVASALSLISCSGDSPAAPQEQARIPKAGSSFVLRGITRDMAGNIVQNKEFEFLFDADNLNWAGRTGVRRVIAGTNTYYYHYDNNGDLHLLVYAAPDDQPKDSTWIAFPYGSHTKTTNNRSYPSMGMDYTRVIEITWLRDQRITINGDAYDTKVIYVEQLAGLWQDGNPALVNESRDTIWFAPSLGWHVRQAGTQLQILGGDSSNYTNDANLVRYTLK